MESNERHVRPGARGRGAVWASLALAAGLAAAPGVALADEAGAQGAAAADQAQAAATATTTATSQQQGVVAASQTQTATPDASEKGGASDQATADGSSQQQATADATQEQQAPAASSDRGTYEQAGLHSLTVTYVDADGSQIAPAHREALADGESYAVESPAVGGYELADASQATVSGTVAKGSGDVSVTVRYRSTLVTYTVVHERQVGPRSSEYRVSETETLTAPSGTRVTAAPRSYDNYTCATGAEGRTAEVTPDGRATIVIRYDVVVPTYGVYFSTNGTYVAPQTGRTGDAVARPADPTRAGYAFAGWDTDGDGAADALPTAIPDHDVTATALWAPAQATYLVKYWGEDEGDDSSTYKYHLLRTDTLTGKTDSAVPTAIKLDTSKGATYQWYQYAREDQGVRVAGDGTTVLNVYYDWKKVKVYFRSQLDGIGDYSKLPDVIEPMEVKVYGSVELPSEKALEVYRANGGKRRSFDDWRELPSWTNVTWSETRIDPKNISWRADRSLEFYFRAEFTDSQMYSNFETSVYQNVDGKTYPEPRFAKSTNHDAHPSYYVEYEEGGFRLSAWRTSTNHWDGKNQDDISWNEWHVITPSDVRNGYVETPSLYVPKANVFEFKYDRIPYDVTYYSEGKVVETRTQLYGTKIDVSAAAAPEAPEGMVFAGWYTASDFSGDPVTSLTMPEGGVHLYARWKRPDVHVTFDAAGGSAVAAETVAWGGKATRPSDPVREGYEFGGWYYQGTGSSTPAPFPFDLALQADARLVAAWRSTNTPTTYTVRHVLADGTVLFEETLPGTVGQTVSALALAKGDARRLGHAYASASGATIDLASDASQNVITFTYSDDASHAYVVHLWDEATGLPVAADVSFDSVEALLDYLAPQVPGYHVLFGGKGYLSTRDGGQELAFWYERDPEPAATAEPSAPANQASYEPRHMAAVPSTGDETSPAAPAAAGALGLGVAALGALLRRRRED
ncbi:MAG: InlB B-repeat-containing protein [Parafannyhessea sp.]|uniref:InlB B-repeat-containing protein n=1 Tax=Parafannyhessea sp. TaxID=2847324 RepID=UPI003F10A074